MAQRLKSVEVGNHIIAVYSDRESKFDEAFEFLRPGLKSNEVMMILTEDMTKDEVRDRMRKEWDVDVLSLEKSGDIIMKTNSEWYFPDGMPNKERTIALWKVLAERSIARGKKGIRAFGDTTAFFKYNLSTELLDYELALEQQFGFPFTAICAYEAKDVKNYTRKEFEELRGHHYPVWLPEDRA